MSEMDNMITKLSFKAREMVLKIEKRELEKQLQAKEQEYEELRQYHNKCCKENAEKLEKWLEKFNQVSRDFYNGKYCNKENCSILRGLKND